MVLKFNVCVDALVLLLQELLKFYVTVVEKVLKDWCLLPVQILKPLALLLPFRNYVQKFGSLNHAWQRLASARNRKFVQLSVLISKAELLAVLMEIFFNLKSSIHSGFVQ